MPRGSLWPIELSSLFILAFFLAVMARRGLLSAPEGRRGFQKTLLDIAAIALFSWVAEVLNIHLFGFYQYDAPWLLFADVMPVLVALIWPFVILSARELAWHLELRGPRGPSAWAVFAIVTYDAALVEPIAVKAGLWSWNEPGIFGVPPIGILGWGLYALSISWIYDRAPRAMAAAPILVQGMLVLAWWGLFRWTLRAPVPPAILPALAALVGIALAIALIRARRRAPLSVMAPRMAAALLFFALLFLRGNDLIWLVLYGVSFALPYLAATRFRG
ncbi:MAG: hypothetical protein U1E65_26925 [Myxococcota bacterium]